MRESSKALKMLKANLIRMPGSKKEPVKLAINKTVVESV